MHVLQYNELDTSKFEKEYQKIVNQLQNDDFHSANISKLLGTPYYHARLDFSNRILFKIVNSNGKKYALMLEIIEHHDYKRSRFLNGAPIDESKIQEIGLTALDEDKIESLPFVNETNPYFYLLDKFISFDAVQTKILSITPPAIIIGSAGSGKTMLALEKMKTCSGKILYVTNSSYLVKNAHDLYHSNQYTNHNQQVDFLSYNELLSTVLDPKSHPINFNLFYDWIKKVNHRLISADANKFYEEIRGVITGNKTDEKYLSKDEYLELGIKQSIFSIEERPYVYEIFEKYLKYLKDNNLYDINLLSFEHLTLCKPHYDLAVIDEIQDFSSIQLLFILNNLKNRDQFILTGDSHQIVHPTFFSWAKIKTFFFQNPLGTLDHVTFILNKNYRNSSSVTNLANKILKIKNARFGSIDKESHYLSESQTSYNGKIHCLSHDKDVIKELNSKSRRSTQFAVIVLHDNQKEEASQFFQTPLVFSIYEAKGLEYNNVILYNIISSENNNYKEITNGVSQEDLAGDLVYRRERDKSDHSIEIFKFYINALYVAVTRAIQDLYIIESAQNHPLLKLLSLVPEAELKTIDVKDSSMTEWENELHRLERQGKYKQADAIRQTVLQTKKVPWEILTLEKINQLLDKIKSQPTQSDLLLMIDHALVYEDSKLADRLLPKINNKKTFNILKQNKLLQKKYYSAYLDNNLIEVKDKINNYGVDFRNRFNQTPLMIAAKYGNIELAKFLKEQSADPYLWDNYNRNALHIALLESLRNQKYNENVLPYIYDYLAPSVIELKLHDKFSKYNANSIEYFTINNLIAMTHNTLNPIRFSSLSDMPFPQDPMSSNIVKFDENSTSENTNDISFEDLFIFSREEQKLNPDLFIKYGNDHENFEWVPIEKLFIYPNSITTDKGFSVENNFKENTDFHAQSDDEIFDKKLEEMMYDEKNLEKIRNIYAKNRVANVTYDTPLERVAYLYRQYNDHPVIKQARKSFDRKIYSNLKEINEIKAELEKTRKQIDEKKVELSKTDKKTAELKKFEQEIDRLFSQLNNQEKKE